MRRQLIAYIIFGLLAYIIFLVGTFPADRAVALVKNSVPQLQLSGVTGSAWSGRATLLQYQGQRLSRFKWQFKPLALLTGQAAFAITFDGDGRRGAGVVGVRADGTMVVTAATAELPMDELSPLLGVPVALGGLVVVTLDELTMADGRFQSAQGELHWRGAAVTSPINLPLGAFSALLTTEASGIKAQIRDEGGALQLEGSLRLINDGSYQFSAKMAVRDPQQVILQQALQSVGRREADGRLLLEYNGRL